MEEWRAAYVSRWEVSSLGRVRNVRLGHILRPVLHGGYLCVGSGPSGRHRVHRLVCIAFHGVEPHGFCVDHIDGDKYNNRATNLRWCDWVENGRKGNRPDS